MKLKREDVTKAVAMMSQSIPFFPVGDLGLEVVQRSIESFVTTTEQLDWLTNTACNTMRKFSLPELRGIFCSRFAPADQMWVAAETPGFTPDEAVSAAEQAYHEREQRDYERKLLEWKEEQKLLGPGSLEPFEIPAGSIKPLPPAKEKPKLVGPPLPEAEAELSKQLAKAIRRTPEENARIVAELERNLAMRADPDGTWLH
jgi:hypothetical protein